MHLFRMLVLLFTVGVVVGQAPNCLHRVIMECGEAPVKEMPTTAEELKTACKAQQEFVKCNADFYGTCDTTLRKAPDEYRYLEHLKKGCNESSENYAVISRNIGCIASKLDEVKEFCTRKEIGKIWQNFAQTLAMSLPGGRSEETAYCSLALIFPTCNSIAISKLCGEELENPAAEMIKNVFPGISYFCSEEILGRIEPHLGVLKESLKE